MQIEAITTFIDLMETQSFSRTADRLGVTQSTVSGRIGGLEAALGETLFERGRAGTRPTAAGRRFLEHALAIRHEWTEAVRAAASDSRPERHLRIGIQADLAEHHVGGWLQALRAALPGTSFYFELDYSTQMQADLLAGDLDLAVFYTPRPSPDLDLDRIGAVRYRLVSTDADRLAGLTRERMIRASYSPAFDREHRRRLGPLHHAPVGAGQNAAVCGLLAALGGAAFVLDRSARRLAEAGVARPVADVEPIDQPVYAAMHLRRRHRPAMQEALRALRRQLDAGS